MYLPDTRPNGSQMCQLAYVSRHVFHGQLVSEEDSSCFVNALPSSSRGRENTRGSTPAYLLIKTLTLLGWGPTLLTLLTPFHEGYYTGGWDLGM